MYNRIEVAEILKRFLNGTCSVYEFDDFISSKLSDPYLDGIRLELALLPDNEPSGDERRYTNTNGLNRIAEIISELQDSV